MPVASYVKLKRSFSHENEQTHEMKTNNLFAASTTQRIKFDVCCWYIAMEREREKYEHRKKLRCRMGEGVDLGDV